MNSEMIRTLVRDFLTENAEAFRVASVAPREAAWFLLRNIDYDPDAINVGAIIADEVSGHERIAA